MLELAAFIISIAALVVSVAAIIVSAVFYFKSAKALQHTTDVLGGYLEGTIKGGDITFKKDKKGHYVNLIHILRPGGIAPQAHVYANATVIAVTKKRD